MPKPTPPRLTTSSSVDDLLLQRISLLLATAGAIERMFAQIAGEVDAVCLLSGGAAERIATLLDIPLRRIDNLVLEGLARIGSSTN